LDASNFYKKGATTMNDQLPKTGFVRLATILSAIPVSKSTWWAGVKTGRYPKSIKHGSSTFWRAEDIHALIESIAKGA
jgi:predicted DNA-binding transcriptional regulator AlpA